MLENLLQTNTYYGKVLIKEVLVLYYKSNKNIVYDCKYHVIWCPKYRKSVLVGDVEKMLKEILPFKAETLGAEIIEMETDKNHVHLLISCDPQYGIHKVVKGLKGFSARVLRENFPHLKSSMPSMWTNSYFCATVGSVSLDVVKQYIENQQVRSKKK
jgi:putative transposase|nr:MAG: Transposase IS200 like [Bacteriophage sp.]